MSKRRKIVEHASWMVPLKVVSLEEREQRHKEMLAKALPVYKIEDKYAEELKEFRSQRKVERKEDFKSWMDHQKEKEKLAREGVSLTTDKREYYRQEYLKSDHWKELKAKKLAMTPACEDCGSRFRVEPHHLEYKNLFDVTVHELKTLCRRCHVKEHKRLEAEKLASTT